MIIKSKDFIVVISHRFWNQLCNSNNALIKQDLFTHNYETHHVIQTYDAKSLSYIFYSMYIIEGSSAKMA